MKVWFSIFALAAALTIGVSSPGSAHQVVVGKLKIGHPWVREAAEGAPGTYSCIIEIQNDGDEPERLLGATIEGAGTGVLYKLTENNGHFTSRPFEEGLVINLCAHADRHGRIGRVLPCVRFWSSPTRSTTLSPRPLLNASARRSSVAASRST